MYNRGSFKPGNKTSFKPGQSGNPKGRPKGTGKYRDESAFHTEEVYGPQIRGQAKIKIKNIARVKEFLEANLGCSRKEVCNALNLHMRTVANAIKTIRGRV